MNRIFFLSVFFSIKLLSAEELNGILVKNNGDTVKQLLKIDDKDIDNYLVSNNLVSKIKDVNGKKIASKKYKYISFKINKEEFHFYAINISENDWDESSTNKPQFYRLLNNKNNNVKLYEFYDISDVVGLGIVIASSIHKKVYKSYLVEKDKTYTVISQIGFKNDIKSIFSDNKELVQKVMDGIYTFSDMPQIVWNTAINKL